MKKMCHNFSGQFFGQADVVAASLPVMPPAPDVDARQYAARARESAANRRGGNDGSDVHILIGPQRGWISSKDRGRNK